MSTNISDAFSSPVVILLGDKEFSFPKFSVNEVADFCTVLKARNTSSVRRFAEECKMTGLELFKILKATEAEEPSIQSIWMHAETPAGSFELALKSGIKSGRSEADAKTFLASLNPQEVVKIALQVTGFVFEDSEKKVTKPVEEPLGFKR